MAEYLLTLEQVEDLFDYVGSCLEETGCDHTRRHTERWIAMHIPEEQREEILAEIEDMGGFCDCEVLMNCYEEYEEAFYDEEE